MRGSGAVRLSVGGEVVLERESLPGGGAPASTDGEVRLNKGLNPIELVYRGPASGDASVRVSWSNDYLPEEPLPPESLRHAGTPALELGRARRAGRDLVAGAMCVRCHAVAAGRGAESADGGPGALSAAAGPGAGSADGRPGALSAAAAAGRTSATAPPAAPQARAAVGMPELEAAGPDLDGVGARLRRAWLERWLLDPRSLRPEARMPQVLSTDAAEARQQAADLAAYLAAADGGPATSGTAASLPPGEVAEGRRLYAEIGCAACHGDQMYPPGIDPAPRLIASSEEDPAAPASGPPGAPASPPASGTARDRTLGAPASPPASGTAGPRTLGAPASPPASDGDGTPRLRDKWRPAALLAYLLDPARFDPWSRMPRTKLEPAEAASLAAYLLTPAPSGGAAPADPLPETAPPETAPAAIQGNPERGRRLADELRCRGCHSLPGGEPAPPASPLPRLTGRAGVWTTTAGAASQHPRYDFAPPEVEAIERFLAQDVASLSRAVPAEYAERRVRSDGCLACHARDGVPASWSRPPAATATPAASATAAASATDAGDSSTDIFALPAETADGTGPDHSPPDLTWAGEKLRSDWLADFLAGRSGDRPRPHLRARMPAFGAHADALAAGLHHQHGLPASPPTVGPVDEELAAIGRDLIRGDRLGCHACHALGDEPALGGEGSEETIDFALARRRLRRPYFDRFLRDPQRILPGTKMPQFVDEDGYTGLYDVFDGVAARQFDAIWHYLGTLD